MNADTESTDSRNTAITTTIDKTAVLVDLTLAIVLLDDDDDDDDDDNMSVKPVRVVVSSILRFIFRFLMSCCCSRLTEHLQIYVLTLKISVTE
jgi:hypothetical protein